MTNKEWLDAVNENLDVMLEQLRTTNIRKALELLKYKKRRTRRNIIKSILTMKKEEVSALKQEYKQIKSTESKLETEVYKMEDWSNPYRPF